MRSRILRLAVLPALFACLFTSSAPAQVAPRFMAASRLMLPLEEESVLGTSRAMVNSSYLLERMLASTWNGTAWVPDSEDRHAYAGDQRVAIEHRNWLQGTSSWMPALRDSYEYEAGRLSVIRNEVWTAAVGAYVPQTRSVYIYPNATSTTLVELREEVFNGASWEPDERLLLTYSGSMPVQMIWQDWSGSNWANVDRVTYEEVGSDLHETSDIWSDGAWVPDSRIIYHGMTIRDLLVVQAAWEAESDFYLQAGEVYLYLKSYEAFGWEQGAWREGGRSRVATDAQGRTVAVYIDEYDGTNWVPTTLVGFEWGPTSLLMSMRTEMFDDSDATWTVISREDYTYDAHGQAVTATMHALDFTNPGDLVPTERYDFWWIPRSGTGVESYELPASPVLEAAWPNPFNPVTMVAFELPQASDVTLFVTDALGRKVATLLEGRLPSGHHEVRFDAGSRPSGIFRVVLVAGDFATSRPLALVR